jgi:hypothetical protein
VSSSSSTTPLPTRAPDLPEAPDLHLVEAPSSLLGPPEPALVRWPHEAARRAQLRQLGRPRVLILDPDGDPPLLWDDLEDWVRTPVDSEELAARVARVRSAVARVDPPADAPIEVRADGLVRVGDREATVGPSAALVVAALLHRRDRPVALEVLRAVAPDGLVDGGLDALLRSIRRRLRPLGVRISAVGTDAVVLFVEEDEGGRRRRSVASAR